MVAATGLDGLDGLVPPPSGKLDPKIVDKGSGGGGGCPRLRTAEERWKDMYSRWEGVGFWVLFTSVPNSF